MNVVDFATANPAEPYSIEAIRQAYIASIGWDGMSPLSFNDMPEPFASLETEATRLNEAAHAAWMARRPPMKAMTEWELRGSKNGE